MSQWLSKAHNYFKTRDAFDASAKSQSKGGLMQWYKADICSDNQQKTFVMQAGRIRENGPNSKNKVNTNSWNLSIWLVKTAISSSCCIFHHHQQVSGSDIKGGGEKPIYFEYTVSRWQSAKDLSWLPNLLKAFWDP